MRSNAESLSSSCCICCVKSRSVVQPNSCKLPVLKRVVTGCGLSVSYLVFLKLSVEYAVEAHDICPERCRRT